MAIILSVLETMLCVFLITISPWIPPQHTHTHTHIHSYTNTHTEPSAALSVLSVWGTGVTSDSNQAKKILSSGILNLGLGKSSTFWTYLELEGSGEVTFPLPYGLKNRGRRSAEKERWSRCESEAEDFPGGSVIKNSPANAGDTGSSPGPGRFRMLWTSKPVRHNYWACALEPASHNYWSPRA